MGFLIPMYDFIYFFVCIFYLQKSIVEIVTAVAPKKPLIPWDSSIVSSLPEEVKSSLCSFIDS